MRIHKNFTRSVVAVLATATIATSFPLAPASAAAAKQPAAKPGIETSLDNGTLDISARRRHYRRNNNAAALGAFAAIAGTIGVIAATQERRRYRNHYGYHYGPRPYGYYGPGYYGY